MCESATDSPSKGKRKRSKQQKQDSDFNSNDEVHIENCEDDASQKSPKKHRHKSNNATNISSPNKRKNIIEDDSEKTPVKKRKTSGEDGAELKKKKRRKVKSGDTNDAKTVQDSAVANTDNEGTSKENTSKSKKAFTVIGKVDELQKKKVERVLPYWLTNPFPISEDLEKPLETVDEVNSLDEHTKERLKANGIKKLFPVQRAVIPKILEGVSRRLYRPPDICVSSPTGSGKTLAFAIPVIQTLRSRIVRRVLALAVLPVQSLALQVYKVFKTYSEGTNLSIGLVVGQTTVAQEQNSLVWKGETGWHSKVDIIVCTPGRLLEHIRNTEGFTLEHLKFLILDEADRLVADESMDWLPAIYSATKHITESTVTKYARPAGLQEYLVRVDASLKPLAVHHLVKERKWKKVLCFTNSRESAHRLSELMIRMGLKTKDFSAKIPSKEKQQLLKDFLSGKINVLISTDAMARGMDIAQVQVVINYDPPIQPKTYIHRVGRTARAGRKGVAVTLVSRVNIKNVTQQLRKAGVGRLEEIQVEEDDLRPLEGQYKEALQILKRIVDQEEKEAAKRRKRTLTKKALPLKIRRKITSKSILKKKKTKLKAESK